MEPFYPLNMPIDTDQPTYTSSQRGYDQAARPWLGGSYECSDGNTWMPDVWNEIRRYALEQSRYPVDSVIDIGCGFGWVVEWWIKQGVRCIGVEGWDQAVIKSRCREHVFVHDYREGPFVPSCEYDLAWSAEFLEHVDEHYMANYMATFKSCRYAVITHGEPGQDGHHHVNCNTDEYWVGKFGQFGFDWDESFTKWMRSTDTYNAPWGRRTLMLFKRR